MEFVAYGHANIEGTHKTTFELTSSTTVTPKGDCIIGTRCNFDPEALRALVQIAKKLKITLKTKDWEEVIIAEPNKDFQSGDEIVVRKTDFVSPRTLAINADKAAADFSPEFKEAIKQPTEEIRVIIERME